MKNLLNHFKKQLRPWYYLFRYAEWQPKGSKATKCVNLRVGENHASRNIYFFIKALHEAGYKVYVCADRTFIRRLLKDHYASFVLTEELIKITWWPLKTCPTIGIVQGCDIELSYDYYSTLVKNSTRKQNVYHVPLGMHPLQYQLKVDKKTFSPQRNQALFFSGNLKPKFYQDFDDEGFFGMPGRLDLLEALKASSLHLQLNPKLEDIKNKAWNKQVLVCDSDCCKVPHEDWREILAKMDYLLAFPGQKMPFCHNVYEAMSVGTIPVLHQKYAALFSPPLADGLHCFTFSDADDFIAVCSKALSTTLDTRHQMHQAVQDYYQQYLTPEAVGRLMTQEHIQTIYLQAEQYSLSLLNKP
jgi:hypothetical protein